MANTKTLRLSESWDAEEGMMADAIRAQLGDRDKLDILEAGCGREWTIDLGDLPYRLTGVDLDPLALDARIDQGDLDEAIHGDLRTVELPGKYDAIYSSYVLEHVPEADQVVDNFRRWLKPGGVMVIRIPDGDTVFGFITKMTPHWFHVFYRKRILGDPNAGKPGHEPYPTFYHPIVCRSGMHAYCEQHGLEMADEWGFPFMAHSETFKEQIVVRAAKALAWLSRGRLASKHQNITFVIRKPE